MRSVRSRVAKRFYPAVLRTITKLGTDVPWATLLSNNQRYELEIIAPPLPPEWSNIGGTPSESVWLSCPAQTKYNEFINLM